MSKPIYHNVRVLVPRVYGVAYAQAIEAVQAAVRRGYLQRLLEDDSVSPAAVDAVRLALLRSPAKAVSAWTAGERP